MKWPDREGRAKWKSPSIPIEGGVRLKRTTTSCVRIARSALNPRKKARAMKPGQRERKTTNEEAKATTQLNDLHEGIARRALHAATTIALQKDAPAQGRS